MSTLRRALALYVVAAACTSHPVRAQTAQWVEVERREQLTAGRTSDDVKRDVLHAALAEAVRRVAGVRVSGSELAVRAESAGRVVDRYSEIVSVDAAGRVTDWTIVRESWVPARKGEGGPSYVLLLRVRVEQDAGPPDPAFQVRIDLNARKLVVRGDDPRGNDELVAHVTATRDAYLALVIVAGDSVFVLAPNALVGAPQASAGRETELPARDLRDAGIHYRASLPPGLTHRSETVIVVAAASPVPFLAPSGAGAARDTGVLSITEFNRWLIGIPAGQRSMAQVTIEVTRTP